MIDKSAIADPSTHYGKGGTRQFMTQRITAVLNIVFTIFFVWFVVRLAGAARATLIEHVRNPFVAIVLCLLIIKFCIHMRIGMLEVIEDYLSEEHSNRLARRANTAFAIAVAVLTVLAIAKILFWIFAATGSKRFFGMMLPGNGDRAYPLVWVGSGTALNGL